MDATERARLLGRFDILEGMSEEALEDLAAAAEDVELATGAVLIRQGDRGEAMYFLTEGLLEARVRQDDGTEMAVGQIHPGRPVGEIQVILGGERSATVAALEDSRAIGVPESAFRELERHSPESFLKIAEIIRRRLRRDQLAKAVGKLFVDVDHEALAMIERAAEWVRLRRGEVLVRQGDPADSWYILITGRLKVEIDGPDGPRVVNELGRGESFGELGIFLDSDRTASLYALRDCDLVRLSRLTFERILRRRPKFMGAIARVLVRRIVQKEKRGSGLDPLLTLTVVPLSLELETGRLCRRLCGALAEIGPTLRVDGEVLERDLGIPDVTTFPRSHPVWIRFAAWLEDQETKYRFIVFEGDGEANSWSRRCLRMSDRVLLAGHAGDPRHGDAATLIERQLDEVTDARRTLVLVHADGNRLPSGTAAWLAAHEVGDHFHLRWNQKSDFARLARVLGETSVGLVLSGGGAKGFAHIGALRALEELGVPIDLIGGTSIGSVISGMYAMGLSIREIRDRNQEIIDLRPFSEYTLPFISLIRTRRMEKGARHAFGETMIEDLWVNYFCVSANLTTARMMVHESGPLWQATRASGALPGILTPVLRGREILVDGGIIDNLPGGVMRRRHRGPLIAVNVGTAGDFDSPSADIPSPARILWSKLLPFRRRVRYPAIGNILMRTTLLSSVSRVTEVKDDADLYLEPPVGDYGLLDFAKLDELIEIGYRNTLEQAASWVEVR
ncbi:MAG: cyclic nucleotide-binding domain-containing protein [bacterium]|nr:cyclic nucleotide-binding domain-containing protein [bacterium]